MHFCERVKGIMGERELTFWKEEERGKKKRNERII